MNAPIPISKNVCWVGANDRTTDLFEGLWPLPRGISYNAYLIRGRKIALIDTIKNLQFEDYLKRLKQAMGEGVRPDYLIVNHLEPDHGGSIGLLHQVFPDLQVIGNKKTAEFLAHMFPAVKNVKVVRDGDTLDLGGRTLKFFLIPMVHWPETMATYDVADKVLFTGDAFGGFGTLEGGIFDDELDIDDLEDEILRYFSNIVARYASMVQRALVKLKGLDVDVIGPSHGPVWRSNPGRIIDMYDRWSRHQAEPGVVIAHASMYGNAPKLMDAVTEGLRRAGCGPVRVHDMCRTHFSYVLRDAWRYKALILGAPTYDTKLFPRMDTLVRIIEHKKLKNRIMGIFGTYGWSGGAAQALTQFADEVGFDLVEPVVEARFTATEKDLEDARQLGRNIAEKLETP